MSSVALVTATAQVINSTVGQLLRFVLAWPIQIPDVPDGDLTDAGQLINNADPVVRMITLFGPAHWSEQVVTHLRCTAD